MRFKTGWPMVILLLTLSLSQTAEALRVAEFMTICARSGTACEQVPVLNAYVGGGLDLIAMLHEETDYIEPVYCKNPRTLFDVPAIIRFVEKHHDGNEEKNAMLLVIRFLETHGGC